MIVKENITETNKFPVHLNSDKIGNIIAILASRIPNLYYTKLLKLLYLIDEHSIKESGLCVTDMKYRVWKRGPVPLPVYYDLTNKNPLLQSFVAVNKVPGKTKTSKSSILLTPKDDFIINDNEFSEYELEVIDNVIVKYGNWTTTKLVNYLHRDGSLWKNVVDKNDLEDYFAMEDVNVTQHYIDFTELLTDDLYKQSVYSSAKSARKF